MAYAYLFKNLEFAVPFEQVAEPIRVRETKVPCFGIGDTPRHQHVAMLEQVVIFDYQNANGFVLELKSKSVEVRLILAKVPPAGKLDEMVRAVLARIENATPEPAEYGGRVVPYSACRGVERHRTAADAGYLWSSVAQANPVQPRKKVLHFSFVPFRLLLPRAAAVVHHGGIGSTAQGLAAGVPQLIMALAHDQFDNAARIRRLGVGDWLKPSRFSGPVVAKKLQALLSSTQVTEACAGVAAKLSQRNGAELTAAAIEDWANKHRKL